MASKKKQKSVIYDHSVSCFFLYFTNRRTFCCTFENISNQHINQGWRRNLGEIEIGRATFLTLENQML